MGKDNHSAATTRLYGHDWKEFQTFCQANNLWSLPAKPETVAQFAWCCIDGGKRWGSIARRLAAIAHFHKQADFVSPIASTQVDEAKKRIKETLKNAPELPKPTAAEYQRRRREYKREYAREYQRRKREDARDADRLYQRRLIDTERQRRHRLKLKAAYLALCELGITIGE